MKGHATITVDLEPHFIKENDCSINRFLEELERRKIKVTFFATGKFIEQYPEIIRKFYVDGHEIATHSFTHTRFNKLTYDEINFELRKPKQILEQMSIKAVGFRSPYLTCNEEIGDKLKEYGYKYFSGFYRNTNDLKKNGIRYLPVTKICYLLPLGLSYLCLLDNVYQRKIRSGDLMYMHIQELFDVLPKKYNNVFAYRIKKYNLRNVWKIYKKYLDEYTNNEIEFVRCRELIR